MSSSHYFKHPQPLSPSNRAKTQFDDDGIGWVKDSSVRGGKRKVKGVRTTDSIYYLWFEYLKRSKNYKKACGYEVEMTKEEERVYKKWREFKGTKNRKSTQKILDDFGDIFKYKTDLNGFTDAQDFYKNWWEKRGVKCFGVRGADMDTAVSEFSTAKDVLSLGSDIDDYEIVLLPKSMPRTLMRKRVGKLISGMPKTVTKQKEADYPILSDRVDVESLRDCLWVYDMMEDESNDYTAVQVYAKIFGIKEKHKHLDLFTDARSERGMLRDWLPSQLSDDTDSEDDFKSQTEEEKLREAEAVAFAEKKMKWRERQRVRDRVGDGRGYDRNKRVEEGSSKKLDNRPTRDLTEDELHRLKDIYISIHMGTAVKSPQCEERAKVKNYYKQQVYRLLRKAKANIEEVEKGAFGVGH